MNENLKIAFPELSKDERRSIARESYYHFCLTILEFLAFPAGTLGLNTKIVGAEPLKAALKKGGVYVLCIHMSSWEAMGSALSAQIAPAHVVVKPFHPKALQTFLTEKRQKNGFYSILRKRKGEGMLAIENVLAARGMVGFVIDQARPKSPRLPLFGKPAKTNTSFAAIWRKAPAPIFPMFITRKKPGEFMIEVEPPIELTVSEDAAQDILAHSLIFNQCVESIIRLCPQQYLWMHDRWK